MKLLPERPLRTLSKELQLNVRRVQVDLLWRNAPAGYIANIMVALAVMLTVNKSVGWPVQLWFASVVIITLIRAAISYFYFATPSDSVDPHFWGRLFIGLTFFTGMAWGVLGGWLYPLADPYGQSLMVVVVIGVTAGAVVTTGFVANAYYMYLATALAPYVFRVFGGDERFDLPLGVIALVYAAFMVAGARRIHGNLVNNLISIHQLEETTRELNRAQHDQLTGLPTRGLLYDRLDQAVLHAERSHKLLAVLFVDLDGFKELNDSAGHDAGDEVLRQLALRFKETVRAEDTVARHGGDEFVLVLGDLNGPADVDPIARKLLAQIAALPIADQRARMLTGSIGVALYPADGKTGSALITSADAAMYRAKQNGKNGYVLSSGQAKLAVVTGES